MILESLSGFFLQALKEELVLEVDFVLVTMNCEVCRLKELVKSSVVVVVVFLIGLVFLCMCKVFMIDFECIMVMVL